MCYILRWHHTLCLPPAKNTNSSNLVRNSPTSLCTVSRETVRRLMVHFHIAGHIYPHIIYPYMTLFLTINLSFIKKFFISPFLAISYFSPTFLNTTSPNIGGRMHGPFPTSNFGGTVPPFTLSLRP